jgi:hypothetical protein
MLTLAHIVLATQMSNPHAEAVQIQAVPSDRPARKRSPPSDRSLRQRTIGMGVASSALGLVWLSMRAMITSSDIQEARRQDRDPSAADGCIESCYTGVTFNTPMSPLLITAAGFAGGSLHAHGRWLARNDRGLGRSKRNGRVLVGSGIALMVGSIATLGVGLGTQRVAGTQRGATALREIGWWSLTALGTSGAALTGLGHGILRGHKDRASKASFAAAPMLGGSVVGLSISGRF